MKQENYLLSQLENGIRVLTVPMPHRESIAIAVWVRVGSRYEPKLQSGISHCIEHMLFKGTIKRSGREIRQAIEGVGGMINAFTGEESTCYFVKLLPRHLETGLSVLSDMIHNPEFNRAELSKEKSVIIEEIKMYKDLPSHLVHDLMSELLWPHQSLGRPISGSEESVANLTREHLLDFKNKHYHNQNILVSIAGDLDHKEVTAKAAEYFAFRHQNHRLSFEKAILPKKSPRTAFLEKTTEQTHLVLGMHTFSRFHPDRYKLAMMNVILGANMSSRLFEIIREKKGLAYEIRSSMGFYHDAGYLSVTAGVENSKTRQTVEVILEELRKFTREEVRRGELSRAKDFFLSQLLMALEDTLDHLLWAGERVIDIDKLPNRKRIEDAIRSVTAEEILEVAKKIFTRNNLHLAMIGPQNTRAQREIEDVFQL